MLAKIRVKTIFLIFIFFSVNALGDSQQTVYSVLSKTPNRMTDIGMEAEDPKTIKDDQRIYAKTGKIRKPKPKPWNEALDNDAKAIKIILSSKDYDIRKEPINKGLTPLHVAAAYGYYPIIEVLLEDDRFRALLSTKDEFGFTPLDLAKIRRQMVLGFISPSAFGEMSGMYAYEFYFGALKPYEKTIELLKKYHANSSCVLSNCYKIILNQQLNSLDQRKKMEFNSNSFSKKEFEGILEEIEKLKNIIKRHILILDQNSHLSEDDLLKKIFSLHPKDFM